MSSGEQQSATDKTDAISGSAQQQESIADETKDTSNSDEAASHSTSQQESAPPLPIHPALQPPSNPLTWRDICANIFKATLQRSRCSNKQAATFLSNLMSKYIDLSLINTLAHSPIQGLNASEDRLRIDSLRLIDEAVHALQDGFGEEKAEMLAFLRNIRALMWSDDQAQQGGMSRVIEEEGERLNVHQGREPRSFREENS